MLLCPLAVLALVAACAPAAEIGVCEQGLTLSVGEAAVLAGAGYVATDDGGLVFETGAARFVGTDRLEFELAGPGADEAEVTARVRRLERGAAVDWTVKYSGPERKWNPWTSGLRYQFGGEISGARAKPVTKWVEPTGAHSWEVAGDTRYPDTECQVREVQLGERSLAMVSESYDPDWIHGGNIARASFARWSLPAETPAEMSVSVAYLSVPAGDFAPEALAAEAAGRPACVTVGTGRVGNLFEPGEAVSVECVVTNVTGAAQEVVVRLSGHDYGGAEVLGEELALALKPREVWRRSFPVRVEGRGIVFVDYDLAWGDEVWPGRTTVGVLPARTASGVAPESPFGMAAMIANPGTYTDQLDPGTVLGQMERIGVRWVRGGWFPFKDDVTDEDAAKVRERVERLREHGILPHVQLGSGVPKAEELEAYKARLAACLERFRWVSPYVEVGNELNHGGLSGTDYVDNMLRPIHEVMREAFPEGKVMSMGLGGVGKKWLGEFVAAGGMDLVDVLSVHPGSHPRAPEFWEGWRGWVFRPQMMDSMKAGREHGDRDVWITEVYAPTSPSRSQLDLRTSADYLVRTYVCAIGIGVKVTEWYQLQDGVWFAQRQRPDDVEYNFGIVYTDLTPKPAYIAYGTMTGQLEGKVYRGRLDLGAEDLYGARFEGESGAVDVLWSYRKKHETDLAWWPPENHKDDSRRPGEPWVERWKEPIEVALAADGLVTVTDIMGNSREVAAEGGKVKLALTGSPVFVRGLGTIGLMDRFWQDIP